MGEIEIRPYDGRCRAEMLSDIAAFWATHYLTVTPEQAEEDLKAWTAEGHELYVILAGGKDAGFLHMGSRGGSLRLAGGCVRPGGTAGPGHRRAGH